ncbi:MAG: hypothetical protein JHC73_06535 [Dolichospermum sp.]|nr:hypothetical protein [Dolichospermum sp.]
MLAYTDNSEQYTAENREQTTGNRQQGTALKVFWSMACPLNFVPDSISQLLANIH